MWDNKELSVTAYVTADWGKPQENPNHITTDMCISDSHHAVEIVKVHQQNQFN